MKNTKSIIALVVVIVLAILVNACGNNQRDKNTNVEQTNRKSQDVERVKTPEELRVEEEQRKEQLIIEQKQRLDAEIKLLDESFNISSYCNSVENMNYLVTLLRARAKMIREGENSDNEKINELIKKLRTKAVGYQIKAFPILRKSYATGLNEELWAVDGKAYVSGNGNIYITVVSPELVQNRMKQEAHNSIRSTLANLRFHQARYKFYDSNDYTYWTVFEGKDADLVE